MNPRKNVGARASAISKNRKNTASSRTANSRASSPRLPLKGSKARASTASRVKARPSKANTVRGSGSISPQSSAHEDEVSLPRGHLAHASVRRTETHIDRFLPQDPNKQKPPQEACIACGLDRERGAKIWSIINIIPAVIYLIFKLTDMILACLKKPPSSKGYAAFYHFWHCPKQYRNTITSTVIDFFAVLIYVSGSALFIAGVWGMGAGLKHHPHRRILLAQIFMSIASWGCLPLIILPKILTFLMRSQCKHSVNEVLYAILLILIAAPMLAWSLYGKVVADSFIWWMKQKELEAAKKGEHHDPAVIEEEVFDVIVRKSIYQLERDEGSVSGLQVDGNYSTRKSTIHR